MPAKGVNRTIERIWSITLFKKPHGSTKRGGCGEKPRKLRGRFVSKPIRISKGRNQAAQIELAGRVAFAYFLIPACQFFTTVMGTPVAF